MTLIALPEAVTHRLMDRFPTLEIEMEAILEQRQKLIDKLDIGRHETGRDKREQNKIIEMKTFMNK